MLKNLIIRQETPADYHQTEQMVMRSFWNKYWPGCTEHLLTRIIRDSRDYVPELSRVAEWNGQIVGAIYYTRAWIVDGDTRREVVTFGPLAVEPMMEGNDIGGALVRETLGLAGSFGAAGIIIMGEPYYYPRFGFRRGAEFGITDAWGNSPDALMVYPLNDDFYSIHGKLIESPDFEKLDDQEALNEDRRGISKISEGEGSGGLPADFRAALRRGGSDSGRRLFRSVLGKADFRPI